MLIGPDERHSGSVPKYTFSSTPLPNMYVGTTKLRFTLIGQREGDHNLSKIPFASTFRFHCIQLAAVGRVRSWRINVHHRHKGCRRPCRLPTRTCSHRTGKSRSASSPPRLPQTAAQSGLSRANQRPRSTCTPTDLHR